MLIFKRISNWANHFEDMLYIKLFKKGKCFVCENDKYVVVGNKEEFLNDNFLNIPYSWFYNFVKEKVAKSESIDLSHVLYITREFLNEKEFPVVPCPLCSPVINYCPYCEAELKIGGFSRFQDLGEHVSDPNGEPALKAEYHCSAGCEKSKGAFWDWWGHSYNNGESKQSLGSGSYYCYRQQARERWLKRHNLDWINDFFRKMRNIKYHVWSYFEHRKHNQTTVS
jgi:hypothetical protein